MIFHICVTTFHDSMGYDISIMISSSSSKFIFQQRTFKNHKIKKYKLHVTCNT